MFIKIKKNCGIYMEQNGLDKNIVVPVTSNFLINLSQVAEISFYSLKEDKIRDSIDQDKFTIPQSSRVIHLQMSYHYSWHQENAGKRTQAVNDRFYYKLYFLPECPGEYEILRGHIEEQVCNL